MWIRAKEKFNTMNQGNAGKFSVPDPYSTTSTNTECFCCKEKIKKGDRYRGLFGASVCIKCDTMSKELDCGLSDIDRWVDNE